MNPAPTTGLPPATRLSRRADMYRAELAQRAGLLRRLGFSRAQATARLRANVDWDFETGGGAGKPSARDIDAIVAGVYGPGA